jgi:hypothetical protein
MEIRLDKCSTFGVAMGPSVFQQFLPTVALVKGVIPAVPIGGHFKDLGRIFDFVMRDDIPKKEIEDRIRTILTIISDLSIRTQAKLKLFSYFIILFHLK